MSKTKLAILLFAIAFGVNIVAFVFSKKSFVIEESKTVWLYELPATFSPLDTQPSATMGPHNGVIGTLFLPILSVDGTAGDTDGKVEGDVLRTGLAQRWTWNEKAREFRANLYPNLTYTDDSALRAGDWVQSLQWAQAQAATLNVNPEWQAFTQMRASAPDDQTLVLKWEKLPAGFEFIRFAQNVLSHPVSGVFHPTNLARLKSGERIVKNWISSGPYRVGRWRAKEISLTSRDPYPVQLPKEFFRTLRFQSAPIKNPSCDFMQGNANEVTADARGKIVALDKDLSEHSVVKTSDEVHVFWVCRSWNSPGRFCADAANRREFAKALSGVNAEGLKGKTIDYRIATGSDAFRSDFRKKIEDRMLASEGVAKELSYFFKESKDTDLELGFVVVPAGDKSSELAKRWMLLSSRVGGATAESDVVGEINHFPLMVLMKRMKGGDPFEKVFLQPDLEEKKLPL